MNKIVEKYFQKNDFSKRVGSVLNKVLRETGFEIEKELFRGMIYDEDKLGSIIYKGKYQNKNAVLKLQGLKPETDEVDIIVNFDKQNTSKKVRLPKLYKFKHWNKKDRFGYLIIEFINAPHIFEMPFANEDQINLFCNFYQEYRENCLNKTFTKPEEAPTSNFVLRRVDMWEKIAKTKGILEKRIPNEKLQVIIKQFKQVMEEELKNVEMIFCHGHLTASDIFYDGEQFILLSNLYWSFRPEYYDLVFGLHWDLENINISNFSYNEFKNYIEKWLNYFYKIPVVKKDPDAKRKISLMLLERTMGGILLDTGSQPLDNEAKNNLFKLRLIFFEELVNNIRKRGKKGHLLFP